MRKPFYHWWARQFAGPEDVLNRYFDDAKQAAAEVGGDLNAVPVIDGQWHNMKPLTGKDEGKLTYVGELKQDSDGTIWPCLTFSSYKGGGESSYWTPRSVAWQDFQRDKSGAPAQPLSSEELAEREEQTKQRLAQAEEQARKRLEADQKKAAEAATKAAKAWADASPCVDHAYLTKKGIAAYGAKHKPSCPGLDGPVILLTVQDVEGGIHSLQAISETDKRMMADGKVDGHFYPIGWQAGAEEVGPVLCIAEGFATAASIHQATGYPVAAAFNCGNLKAVAEALRAKYPDLKLILCADDDRATAAKSKDGKNPGIFKATEAAAAVGGLVAVPAFGADSDPEHTDFNDLASFTGLEQVKQCIEAAKAPEPVVKPSALAEQAKPAAEPSNPVKPAPKPKSQRAKVLERFRYGLGEFQVKEDGVWYQDDETKEGGNPYAKFICSKLEVFAETSGDDGRNYGRLLRWQDSKGRQHSWPMPMSLLQDDGSELRKELADCGLIITAARKDRGLLVTYIQSCPVTLQMRCVDRLGWSGPVFATPTKTIAPNPEQHQAESVIFQSKQGARPKFSQKGSLEDWRDTVARLAAGNSRLVFSISVAFAGPLLQVANQDGGGGFHLRGASSIGKSTALKAAASVWGSPAFAQSWRSTTNGLEGLAMIHNDCALILDEISQMDSAKLGDAVYTLINGVGKVRAGKEGLAKDPATWQLFLLSSGEEQLASLMAQSGCRTNAGHEVRLADIEADAGAGMGMFEQLHQKANPGQLANDIKHHAGQAYGLVGQEWLTHIVKDRAELEIATKKYLTSFKAKHTPSMAGGQVDRVVQCFGLVAWAGELATRYGLTGWKLGEADKAAASCLASWLETMGGTGNIEERKILEQCRKFFAAHGASRFELITDRGYGPPEQLHADRADMPIRDRMGYYKVVDGSREYYVLSDMLGEIIKGFGDKLAKNVLIKAGYLLPSTDGKTAQNKRLPLKKGTTRCYVFSDLVFGENEDREAEIIPFASRLS